MEKEKIVFASVLKPADEVRMYEKLGASLLKDPRIDVIFFGSKAVSKHSGSGRFEDDHLYTRNPISRVARSIKFIFWGLKIEPAIIVLCTWELILPSLIIKMIRGSHLVYDIQENYYRNTLGSGFIRQALFFPIACLIRSVEFLGNAFFSKIIMAEECYLREMKSFSKNTIVLKNKALQKISGIQIKPENKTTLVYNGTISNQTGLKHIEKLAEIVENQNVIIKIIGHCTSAKELKRVQALEEEFKLIKSQCSLEPISHEEILAEVKSSQYCLALYENNNIISGRIPTKFYECLGSHIPVITLKNKTYESFYKIHGGGITINSIAEIPRIIQNNSEDKIAFHFKQEDVFWMEENKIFEALIFDLLDID